MSSGRPSRTVVPNAGRRRSDFFNSFPRAPRRLSPSSPRRRPSISSRSNLRRRAMRRRLSIRSSPRRPSNRNNPLMARAPRCPNSRAYLSGRRHRSIPRLPAMGRHPAAIRPSSPDMEAFIPLGLRPPRAHPSIGRPPACRPNPPSAGPATRLRLSGLNSRCSLSSRTASHPRHPSKAASRTRSRGLPIKRRLKTDPTHRRNRRASLPRNPCRSSRGPHQPLLNHRLRHLQASRRLLRHRLRRNPQVRPRDRLLLPSGRNHPSSVRPPPPRPGRNDPLPRLPKARLEPFFPPSRRAASVRPSARLPRPSHPSRRRNRGNVPRCFAQSSSCGPSLPNRRSPTRPDLPGTPRPWTPKAASTFARRDVFML